MQDVTRGIKRWMNLVPVLLLAEALGCEFGVTQDGEPRFRNKTAEAKVKHPIHAIKRK